jgi:hypothetical protein
MMPRISSLKMSLEFRAGSSGSLPAEEPRNTFSSSERRKQRKVRKRGKELAKANKKDALFSEHAIYAAQSRWEKHDIIPDTKIPTKDIQRIIEKYEEFAEKWSKLPVGSSITMEWKHKPATIRKR